MTITLNGQPQTLAAPATVLDLLAVLGFGGRPVVVELNQQALLPREHATAGLNEGDVIEIVQITAGG
ncbi:MAG: molybdopterin synthase/thiamine biosynthesis sulfur carrier beta-grasp [Verrucomicrobiaceae bacterium]|nr:molybdopterin synthase/thiamine biosynthesis sulfur carrier beta-grasp [Verrucomicrobiaceae bacterium]